MKLRLLALLPSVVALPSLLQGLLPVSWVEDYVQLLMTPSTAFGLITMSLIWFAYLTGNRYAQKVFPALGFISLPLTILTIVSFYLGLEHGFEKLYLQPGYAPFMLNLAIIFCLCYAIQILYRWLPRTRIIINVFLAIILFIALLSISGHVYNLDDSISSSFLLPVPPTAIAGFILVALLIFFHVNRMERLYISRAVLASFFAMFIAIVGTNVAIYHNITKASDTSEELNETYHVLGDVYNIDLSLGGMQSSAKSYATTGDRHYLEAYQADKKAYQEDMEHIFTHSQTVQDPAITESVIRVRNLGRQISVETELMVTLKSQNKLPARQSNQEDQFEEYQARLLTEVKNLGLAYSDKLHELTQQQTLSNRGIIVGTSISSVLGILLLLFTPLFIRQTIRQLVLAQQKIKTGYRQLFDEKSRAEAVLSSIGDGLFVVDTNRVITDFNQAAETITGLKKEAVIGKQYEEVMHFTSTQGAGTGTDFTTKALKGVKCYLGHGVTLQLNQSRSIEVQISAAPIKSGSNKITGAIVVFRDRTNEQQLENAKDEFVSLASHQLRTPATATKQFLAMFLQGYAGPIDDKQRLYLQQAYDNNELGISIIEELLNITRFESDKFKLENVKIELADFLRSSISQQQTFAERGGQTIKLIAPQKSVYIRADRNLLSMLVDNLITNALKYSNQGDTVTVRVKDGELATIEVSDTGIGIREEDLPRLFKRFSRLEDQQKVHTSGTGLGLYLAQKIAHRLHAKIKVESEYGKGSTFILEFKSVE